MVTYQIPPPEKFDFSHHGLSGYGGSRGSIKHWICTEKEKKVNMLIYTMGYQADDILMSFSLSADDQKKYSTVNDKFENHFVKKCNIIFERAQFNQRKQEEGESVDTFINYISLQLCGTLPVWRST